MIENLKIYKKTEMLMFRCYPALKNFPKHERYALVQQIKNHFIDLLASLARANAIKSKRKQLLQESDALLQNLKVLFRLSKAQRYIKPPFHEEIDESLTEINKMLVGYLRSV